MCLAIPGRIMSLNEADPPARYGRVDFGGVVKEVNLAAVPEAQPGTYVIVHAGVALSTVDEAEARQVFAYLEALGALAEGEIPA